MGPQSPTADMDKLLTATAVMRAIMQMAGMGRRSVGCLKSLCCGGSHRHRGLGISRETPCKAVWNLAGFWERQVLQSSGSVGSPRLHQARPSHWKSEKSPVISGLFTGPLRSKHDGIGEDSRNDQAWRAIFAARLRAQRHHRLVRQTRSVDLTRHCRCFERQ